MGAAFLMAGAGHLRFILMRMEKTGTSEKNAGLFLLN
jgi:hypothetical protein